MSGSRMNPWRTMAFASVLVGLPISACDCGAPVDPDGGTLVCGAGTSEVDGVCVADGTDPEDAGPGGLECGPGTVANAAGTECVPDLDCVDGTEPNTAGTACIPICENPFVYDDVADACACALGLTPTDDGLGCEVDPALCGEGTIFRAGACVPLEPPDIQDDDLNGGNPVVIELDDSKPVEVGGLVGPVDRVTGPDLDVFDFVTTEAFTRIRIQLISFGLPNGAFVIIDNESGLEVSYQRFGLSGPQRRAVRELVLPFAGSYSIIVSDINNLSGGLPVGGDDFDYALSIEVLPSSPATSPDVDGTPYAGQHEDVDAYTVSTDTAPRGSILNAVLEGNADLDPTCNTQQLLWYVDSTGTYQEFAGGPTCEVNALLPQPTGGIRFHVDYFLRITGEPYDYALSINNVTVNNGPPNTGDPIVGDTGGEPLTFFSVTAEANHVYRARAEFPTSSTLDADFLLVNSSTLAIEEVGAAVNVDGTDYLEMQFFTGADDAGDYFLVVQDFAAADPLAAPNTNVRFTLDDAPVGFTATPSIAGGPVVNVEPQPALDNDWAGPWTMVRVDEIADLTIATDATVAFRALAPETMTEIVGSPVDGAPVLPAANLAVEEGACDAATALTLTDNGDYTVNLVAPTTDFTDLEWGACSRGFPQFGDDGSDFYVRVPAKPAGTTMTVITLNDGDNAATDTNLGLLATEDCVPALDACIASDDDGGGFPRSQLEYTFTGTEGTLLLLVDSYAPGFVAGTARISVEFAEPANELLYQLVPGTRILTQAIGGTGAGDFTHTTTALVSPFTWETEPNNNPGTADVLAIDADPTLNGFLGAGDFDWWEIDVTAAGFLSAVASTGPIGLNNAALEVSLFAADGTTQLATAAGFLDLTASSYVFEAGTYYISVGATEALTAFDYNLTWSLDTDAEVPSTCADPMLIAGPGTYAGTTLNAADVWSDDLACLSAVAFPGTTPANYAGQGDEVWSLTIPVGSTLRVTSASAADLALVLAAAAGCEDGECLAGADVANGNEELLFTNDTVSPIDARLIVTNFSGGGAPVGATYTLDVALLSAVCFPGQSQCNADSTALETCNADGTAFDVLACSAGCAFDDFEQVASCTAFCGVDTANPALDCSVDGTELLTCAADQGRYESAVCGSGCETEDDGNGVITNAFCTPFCGAGAVLPQTRCNGGDLETCAADQESYDAVTCDVACTDIDDGLGAIIGGACTFGACATPDSTVCGIENFGAFGDVAVTRSCNADASADSAVSCAAGCNGDNSDCAGGAADNPVVVTANAGVCTDTLATATLVDASSTFTLTLDAATGNDSDLLNCALDVGNDVFFRLPGGLAAGTTATVSATATAIAPSATPDLILAFFTDCADACVGLVDVAGPSETTTYTYTGAEVGEVFVIVDEFFGAREGTVDVTVEFGPPAPQPVICDTDSCDVGTNVATTCEDVGTTLSSNYCANGCDGPGTGCEFCPTTSALDLTTLPLSLVGDLTTGTNNLSGSCGLADSGPELVYTFTATADASYVVSSVGVNSTFDDTVAYVFAGTCSSAELTCDDDGAEGFGSEVTFDAVTGETYFIVIDTRSSVNAGFPVDIVIDLAP